jgi:hypothetical protein
LYPDGEALFCRQSISAEPLLPTTVLLEALLVFSGSWRCSFLI